MDVHSGVNLRPEQSLNHIEASVTKRNAARRYVGLRCVRTHESLDA